MAIRKEPEITDIAVLRESHPYRRDMPSTGLSGYARRYWMLDIGWLVLDAWDKSFLLFRESPFPETPSIVLVSGNPIPETTGAFLLLLPQNSVPKTHRLVVGGTSLTLGPVHGRGKI